jgi:hypothetical protein
VTRVRQLVYQSQLQQWFGIAVGGHVCLLPGHVVVPDLLSAGDLGDVIAALPATVRMEEPVDAPNRLVSGAPADGNLVEWLVTQFVRR